MQEDGMNVAKFAVYHASKFVSSVQSVIQAGTAISKADTSPVTVADYASQVIVSTVLQKHFLNSPTFEKYFGKFVLLGEEDVDTLLGSGQATIDTVVDLLNQFAPYSSLINEEGSWTSDKVVNSIRDTVFSDKTDSLPSNYWVLDPIDGTKGFLRGGQYAVGLAYMRNNTPSMCVIGCPNLPSESLTTGDVGVLFSAIDGQGSYVSRMPTLVRSVDFFRSIPTQRVKVSDKKPGDDLILAESFDSKHSDHEMSAAVASALGIRSPSLRLDSMCKYGLICRGEAHLMLKFPVDNYIEKVWDHAMGALLLKEAGGMMVDINGKTIDFSKGKFLSENSGIIGCSNPAILEKLLPVIQEQYKSKSSK